MYQLFLSVMIAVYLVVFIFSVTLAHAQIRCVNECDMQGNCRVVCK